MNFIIFNLADGSQKPCDLAKLSRSLSPNCEIVRMVGDKHEAIGFVCHKTLVHFAVESANYALQNHSKEILPEAQACIDLIKKWIEDSSSVSNAKLSAAANAAYAAYVAYTAYADANANAATAYAAYTAATDAAGAAVYHANAAADYATDAAGKNKLNEQNRQGNFILKFFEVE